MGFYCKCRKIYNKNHSNCAFKYSIYIDSNVVDIFQAFLIFQTIWKYAAGASTWILFILIRKWRDAPKWHVHI